MSIIKRVLKLLKIQTIETGLTVGSPDNATRFYASNGDDFAHGPTEAEAIQKLKARRKG